MDKKRLKIAFLSRYLGKVNRGAETYVLELSKRLSKNHDVEVLTGADSDSLRKMISGKYDLVIPTNGRMQALRASLGRIPGGYKTLLSGQAGPGRDDIWNITVTAPDIFVALTGFEYQWARRFAWKSKLVKIPNGVDLEKFRSGKDGIDINLPRPIILSVGALTWYKHHEKTIEALKILDKGSLLIIGAGPLKGELLEQGKSLVQEGRLKIIEVPYQDIPMYYRSADLFVLPSWDREAFGIVYIEALASNLPVVAPDDKPRREIVGGGGLFTDVSDPVKYAAAIDVALSTDWQNKPREQAEEFSWDKVAGKYEDLIEEVFG